MKWFYNMKIGKKLIGGFLLVAAIAVAIGLVGYMNIKMLAEAEMPSLEALLTLADAESRVIIGERGLLITRFFNDPKTRQPQYDFIDLAFKEMDEAKKTYESLPMGAAEVSLWKDYISQWDAWKKDHDAMIALSEEKARLVDSGVTAADPRMADLDAKLIDSSLASRASWLASNETLKKMKVAANENAAKAAHSSELLMLIMMVFGGIIAVILGVFISRIISRPVSNLAALADKLALGDVNVAVEADTDDEIGDLMRSFEKMTDSIRDKAAAAEQIAAGNLTVEVEARSANDVLANSLKQVITTLRALVAEAGMLTNASVNGKLDVRGNADNFKGGYRDIVKGINDTLDAVIGPLNVAAEYIDRISKGDIPPKVTDSYNGDFNEIKNNLNQCIDGLGGLVEANQVLQKMTTNDYSIQVRGHYQGVFAEVGQAVNEVQERINHVIATVNLVSRGDLKDLETYRQIGNGRGKRSENDELVPALIRMMENIKRLVDDAESLATAGVAGQLSTRADASKHEGDFRKVVAGVNDTLDAVIEPVNEAVGVIEAMAEGDLSQKVTGDYQGDHAKMKDALNRTLESLNDILGQVNVASEQVVSGSAQVSDSSQSLSQGATESASSLEEITSSMTEMTSQTKQNADNAQQANKLAAAARDNAEQGNSRMSQMLDAMKEINESSDQISKIIKVIDEIAFQTNLLALNAAVEAARAGVHGKGFAVVADEVRNLAQRSAKAAKETTELIETSIKKVENGTGIANETAKALTEIVSGVTKVTDLVGEIASASNEQAQGIGQVNQGLGQIDQVTQANTANAEESAAAAEELSGQASNLKQMLTRFRLANTMTMVRSFDSFQSDQKESPRVMKALPAGSAKAPKGGRKAASKDARSSSNPADIIALDDEDFGKF